MKWTLALALFATVSACGGGDDDDDDGTPTADAAAGTADAAASTADAMPSGADAMPAAFSLTSTAFANGAVIPTVHSCLGSNSSPPLAWENAPMGTQSFAIVFTDISTDFLHSVTWDIAGSTSSIPADIDKSFEPADLPGAKQADSYLGSPGYAGPCPGTPHTYEFKLHAVDVATLPGLGAQSTGAQARAAVEAASLGFTTLEGTFDPNNP